MPANNLTYRVEALENGKKYTISITASASGIPSKCWNWN